MRTIDADKFKEENKELLDCEIEHPRIQVTLRQLIDEAPIVGELHGEWITYEQDYHYANCSVCDFAITKEEKEEFNFCPNCGASMRKVR